MAGKGAYHMLFPEVGSSFYDDNDRRLIAFMENFYKQNITMNQAYWYEADTDTRFYCNDQTIWDAYYGTYPAASRRSFSFNKIRRIISMIEGNQRKNRKSSVIIPRENGDEETADQYTKLIMWAYQQEYVLETISESFLGACVAGMNLLHVWMDYRNDPINGDLRVDNTSYNAFVIDPFFRKADMSDCNGVWKRSYLTRAEVLSLMPNYADIIMSLSTNAFRDGKFQFTPQQFDFNKDNLISYDEFWYRDYRKQTLLVDTKTGETTEWHGNSDDLKRFLMFAPNLTTIVTDIPTVKLAIVAQGKVLYNDVDPSGLDTYPFVPVWAYYTPELPYFPYRCQSVVRDLRDPQYLYNRRKIIEVDILESQRNSGFYVKENAVVNPKDLYGTGQGTVLFVKEDASLDDIRPIVAPQIPPSMFQISETFNKEMMEISGVSEEMMGASTQDIAGFLSMMRMNAGLTTLQRLFDQLDRSQNLLTRICLKYIQINWTPGKVARVLGEQPSEQFYNRKFGKYDAAVEDGLNTTTQRQMQFAQMIQLKQLGIPITDEDLIESATLQGKKKLIENMQKQKQQMMQVQQQQMQMQQQQMMMDMKEAQARIEMTKASAVAADGLGVERLSRVAENQALVDERRSKAEQARSTGLLDIIKAAKELDGIDIEQTHRVIELLQLINAQQQQDKADTGNDVRNTLSQIDQQKKNINTQENMASQMPQQ